MLHGLGLIYIFTLVDAAAGSVLACKSGCGSKWSADHLLE